MPGTPAGVDGGRAEDEAGAVGPWPEQDTPADGPAGPGLLPGNSDGPEVGDERLSLAEAAGGGAAGSSPPVAGPEPASDGPRASTGEAGAPEPGTGVAVSETGAGQAGASAVTAFPTAAQGTQSGAGSPPPCPGGQPVQVQPGDSLFLLAQRYGVPLAAVILANPQLRDVDRLQPGQWICIPSAPPRCPGGRLVTVSAGDTLFSLAQRRSVPLEALVAANPQLADPDRLVPGQVLCIPRAPAGCDGTLHVVAAGETLWAIGQRYNVPVEKLLAANPQITRPERIYVGEVVCIPPAQE